MSPRDLLVFVLSAEIMSPCYCGCSSMASENETQVFTLGRQALLELNYHSPSHLIFKADLSWSDKDTKGSSYRLKTVPKNTEPVSKQDRTDLNVCLNFIINQPPCCHLLPVF